MAQMKMKLTAKIKGDVEKTIANGVEEIRKRTDEASEQVLNQFALDALVAAVKEYDFATEHSNLTGNTRTSFCAAVFYKGKVKGNVMMAYKLPGIKHYTYGYVNVGEVYGKGSFVDYDSGEKVTSVKKYKKEGLSFVHIEPGGLAYLDTRTFLESEYKQEQNKDGWSVAVASISPYVEFLVRARGYEILDASMGFREAIMKGALNDFGTM